MCIIVAKNKEVKKPSIETLEQCFTYNSDGAGFMYTDKGKVVIDKGYMDFDSFKKHYERLCKKFNDFENKSLVIHFRIGTSGTNTKENTHPYCISEDYNELHKTHVICDLGMAHNGIISNYTPIENIHNTNDTQEFIMKYIAPLYNNYKDFYKNEYIMEGIDKITNSKLAFLDSDDNIYLVGYFIDEDGIKYSNGTYKKYDYSYLGYYNNWDDWYEPAYDKDKKEYIDKGYDYEDDEILSNDVDMKDLLALESDWYIGNGYNIESVKGRQLYVDSEYNLYEERNGNLYLIGRDTYVFDENYDEVV